MAIVGIYNVIAIPKSVKVQQMEYQPHLPHTPHAAGYSYVADIYLLLLPIEV